MNILDIPVYCVNLDRRQDRWLKFSQQPGVKRIKNLQRFSAIDGKTLSPDDERISLVTRYNIQTKTRRSHNDINTIGAVGAAISHSTVWREFLEKGNAEYCMIMEDDAQVPYTMIEKVFSASQDLSQINSFDLWLLEYATFDKKVLPINGSTKWLRPNDFYGFVCYIISRAGAKKLLDGVFPVEMHIDRYANMKMQLGELKIVIHKNLRIGTLGSKSDIQLGGCRICNVPTNMEELRAINRWYVIGLVGYAATISFLYLRKNNS
jgi:GR25 family glycosyltransferase involved in LPS biosynthesis